MVYGFRKFLFPIPALSGLIKQMKNIPPVFLFAVFILSMGSGCGEKNKYRKEIAMLDSVKAGLNALRPATDTSLLAVKIAETKNNFGQLDSLLPDTVTDKDLAALLMDYRSTLNSFLEYPYKIRELKNTAGEIKKRVGDLQNDLVKDIADEKQVKNFLEDERQNAINFSLSFSAVNAFMEKNIKRNDSLGILIKGRIAELERRGKK